MVGLLSDLEGRLQGGFNLSVGLGAQVRRANLNRFTALALG